MGSNYRSDTPKGKRCPVCGIYVDEKDDFCTNCGTNLKGNNTDKTKKNGNNGKNTMLGVFVAVILVLIIAVVFVFFQMIQVKNTTDVAMQPATQPTTQPTEPVTQPTTQPTEPVTQPTTQPTEAATQPTTQPTEPVTQPTTQPTEPVTQPTTQPTEPATQPAVHSHTPVSIGEARAATCMESGFTSGIKCSECGEILEAQVLVPKKNHRIEPATCTKPETCSVCGTTQGAAKGHVWKSATCSEPETCSVCGATRGVAKGHVWQPATCANPETCAVCGTTQGTIGDHLWTTNSAAGFCSICGVAKGTYLNEMTWSQKNCKFYFHSFEPVTFWNNWDWNDINTNGYVASTRDIWDNIYRYGMHLDSGDPGPYWVEYNLEGKYTKFTGTISSPFEVAGGTRPPDYWLNWNEYYKIVTIYLDGKPVWTSPHMSTDSQPLPIDLDITGAMTFKVEYTGSDYANEITVLYDGLFS